MIQIVREDSSWVLHDGGFEVCRADDVSFDEALDAFAANMPEYMELLDELKCDEDFLGPTSVQKKSLRRNGMGPRKKGSGARFRELIQQGKSNEECVRIVREEFPDSRATLSDAAWNRAALRKNPEKYGG